MCALQLRNFFFFPQSGGRSAHATSQAVQAQGLDPDTPGPSSGNNPLLTSGSTARHSSPEDPSGESEEEAEPSVFRFYSLVQPFVEAI